MARLARWHLTLLALATGCRTSGQAPASDTSKAPPDAASGGTVEVEAAAAASRTEPSDGLGSIYPDELPAHPLAQRLCDALHLVPGRRVASCCGGEPRRYLFDQCVRVLSASMASGSLQLDPADVQKCEARAAEAFEGCGWVTPSQPSAPPSCQGLLQGIVREGEVCRSSLECSDHRHCDGLGPTRTGVCKPPRQLGAGCGVQVDVLATYTLQTDVERSHPLCTALCSLVSHRCELAPEAGTSNRSAAPSAAAASAARGPQCAVVWPASVGMDASAAERSMRLPVRPPPRP